jgi:hypothetical protein
MELVDAACFPGLSPEAQRQQLYLAFYNWAADDTLLDPLCFPGSTPEAQDAAMLSALLVQGGDADPLCVGGWTAQQRAQAIYASLYAAAADDSLPDPSCLLGYTQTQVQQAIYTALYAIAGDDTMTDPSCFYGLTPAQQGQALFSVASIVSIGDAPPVITNQPDDTSISYEGTANLSVSASGSAPKTYQWYIGNSGDTSTPIGGATSNSFTTPSLTETTTYWVRATNPFGTADSDSATVMVGAAPIAPTFTLQPADSSISSGETETLVVEVDGTLPITFQWYAGNSGDTSSPIGGATGTEYETPALTETTSYWVRATNTGGSADSETAVITVESGAVFPEDLPGLEARYKADGLAYAEEDAVPVWEDMVNGHDLSQGSGSKQPIFYTGILNGKAVVTFDGADDDLTITPEITLTDFTLYVISATTGDSCIIGSTSGNFQSLRIGESGANKITFFPPDGNGLSDTLSTPRGQFNILVVKRAGLTVSFYENGVAKGTITTQSMNPKFGAIGSLQFVSVLYTTGDIAEVIICTDDHNNAALNSVFAYASAEYGISVSTL